MSGFDDNSDALRSQPFVQVVRYFLGQALLDLQTTQGRAGSHVAAALCRL